MKGKFTEYWTRPFDLWNSLYFFLKKRQPCQWSLSQYVTWHKNHYVKGNTPGQKVFVYCSAHSVQITNILASSGRRPKSIYQGWSQHIKGLYRFCSYCLVAFPLNLIGCHWQLFLKIHIISFVRLCLKITLWPVRIFRLKNIPKQYDGFCN